jgi:TIR domain
VSIKSEKWATRPKASSTMADIFISYSRGDQAKAENLAGIFSRNGMSVWWDRQIPPGATFDEIIEKAIRSAKCVIVLWSKESVKSRWVKAEAGEAVSFGTLVPVLIQGGAEIPMEFKRIQTTNLSDWQGEVHHPELEKLFETVAGKLESGAVLQTAADPFGTRGPGASKWRKFARVAVIPAAVMLAIAAGSIVILYRPANLSHEPENKREEQRGDNVQAGPVGARSEKVQVEQQVANTKKIINLNELPKIPIELPVDVSLPFNNGYQKGMFKVLRAAIITYDDKLSFYLYIRLSNLSSQSILTDKGICRLWIDDVQRAPDKYDYELLTVESNSSKEFGFLFYLPFNVKKLEVQFFLTYAGEVARSERFPIDLNAVQP